MMDWIYLWWSSDGPGYYVQCDNKQLKLNETPTVVAFYNELRERSTDVTLTITMKKISYDSAVWAKLLDFGVEVVD